jgi:hypothetical protein
MQSLILFAGVIASLIACLLLAVVEKAFWSPILLLAVLIALVLNHYAKRRLGAE